MGYRSDVAVLIYPEAQKADTVEERTAALNDEYNKLKLLMGTTYKTLMDDDFGADAEWDDIDRELKFHFKDVKWYDSYPDVQRFMQMLEELGDTSVHKYAIEFVRIGEDNDDTERREWGDTEWRVDVRREIVFN